MTTRADRAWVARLRRAAGAVRWYVRGVTGADAYERYLRHQLQAHPGQPPLTERAFWREHTDDRDTNPRMRCC